MLDLLKAEILKVRSTRTAFGLLIAALLIAVVPTILAVLLIPKEELVQTEGGLIAVLGIMPAASLIPILCLVFGILSMTNEYRHGTVSYTYLTTPRRGHVIVVKLVVCAVIGAAVMLVTGLLAVVTAGLGAELRGIDLGLTDVPQGADWELLRDVSLVLLTTGLATSFGVALGALIRHQVIAVAGTLIWALAVENIITGLKPAIGQWLPFTVFLQVVVNTGEIDEAMGPSLSSLEAFAVALAYIALASVAAVFITMRRDVT
jgi:ABC-2 type transport system permease protein